MKKLFYNGTILTLEENIYAEALLIEEEKILKVGTLEEVEPFFDENTERVDLKGKIIMPSFIDAHSHFSAFANSLLQVSLDSCTSFIEIQETIKEFITKNEIPEGQWVIAKGYDHNHLQEKAHPKRDVLDIASPKNPLLLQHQSGHVGVFNSLGLEVLGVTENIQSPLGGLIEKEGRALTGYMEETAFMKYQKMVPMADFQKMMDSYKKVQDLYLSYGITTVQEGMMVKEMIPIFQGLLKSNLLKIDIVGYMGISDEEPLKQAFPSAINKYDGHFKIGGYKIFLDGSPQGRTAWMRKPYLHEKEYCGYPTLEEEEIKEAIIKANKDQLQLLAHCNGDRAAMEYCLCLEKSSYSKELRPVMIHAQLLDRDQLSKVKNLGIIPSFFIAHIFHFGDTHIQNFGLERASRISLAKSALKKNIRFTFHEDSPVIAPNMWETIWVSRVRMTQKGIILGEDEKIPVIEAIKAVTINAAYQYHEENQKGSLKEGKEASFIIIDKDPLVVEEHELRDIKVLETYAKGKCLYQKEGR